MNNYPVWWDSTVTVFNRYEDEQTHVIKWFKTVLTGCFWKNVGETVNINDVRIDTNNIICRIPKNEKYKPPHKWIELANDEKPNYFTLKQNDIIVVDEIDDEIDEYMDGKRSTDFLTKYKALQGCMTIQEVGDNTGIGRGDEHYRVNGL